MDSLSEEISVFDIWMNHITKKVLHAHDFHELFFCLEGRGFQYVDDRTIKMKKNDFFFFPATQWHIGNGTAERSCLGGVIYLKDTMFSATNSGDRECLKILDLLGERAFSGNNIIKLTPTGTTGVRTSVLELLKENREKKSGHHCGLKIHMQNILLNIIRDIRLNETVSAKFDKIGPDKKITDVCSFIQNNYMNEITIEEMTRVADMSRSHFHALFHQTTGKSPITYLNEIKIANAIKLIEENEIPLPGIAVQCGFSSISHFYHIFKSVTGKSPGKYLKTN